MRYVLDASAALAYFKGEVGGATVSKGEVGGATVSDLLLTPSARLSMHSINTCEVYYHMLRNSGSADANKVVLDILSYGIEIIDELDPKVWKAAGVPKIRYTRLSLADAIGVAYTNSIKGVFVTGDHAELDRLNKDGVCDFFFFR